MKKRKVYQVAAALSALVFLCTGAGCDKVVQSAVVQEKEDTKTGNVKEADIGGEVTENRKASDAPGKNMLTVPEQVMAPEVYTVDFTEEKGGVQENEKGSMKVSVSVNAPVEVPRVDAVRLKTITELKGETAGVSFLKNLAVTLNEGREIDFEDMGFEPGALEGEGSTGDFPFTASITHYHDYEPDGWEGRPFDGITFSWQMDYSRLRVSGDGLENKETGTFFPDGDKDELEKSLEDAKKILKELNLRDFQVYHKLEGSTLYQEESKTSERPLMVYDFERVADGIPVNAVMQAMYLDYKAVPALGTEESEKEQRWLWKQERVSVSCLPGRVVGFTYTSPRVIGDYSDEKLYLLPFEEIRQIFENTVVEKITGQSEKLIQATEIFNLYPGYTSGAEVFVKFNKIKLGYMAVPQKDSNTEGLLIPVWDFYGTWEKKAGKEERVMDNENVSLLTIDARDGTVLDRRKTA